MNIPLSPRRYNDYSTFIQQRFEKRVQKIAIDVGFTCPNRDGSKGTGGCIYCNNKTFNPFYCSPSKTITQQLHEGIAFFAEKYKSQQYLAYFQAYSNTYASTEQLRHLYNEALSVPGVIGLVIATRPDCVNDETLDLIAELNKNYFIVVEYGVESTNEDTLNRINRGHTYSEAKQAILETAARGILTSAHLILGLPGETEDMLFQHAHELSKLPLHTIKLHQLQIIKDTTLARMYHEQADLFHLYSVEEYIDLVIGFAERLHPNIIIERFLSESPRDMIIAPHWDGIKNFEFIHKLDKRMEALDTWQGKKIL